MKIKVSEAKLIQLDWLVAKCLGLNENVLDPFNWLYVAYPMGCYAYSRNWEVGGPIIERERIEIKPTITDGGYRTSESVDAVKAMIVLPNGATKFDPYSVVTEYGQTPLIAAMRCYVVSKLGEEVEVPDELGVST